MHEQPDNPPHEEQGEQRPDDAEEPDVYCLVGRAEFACDPVEEDNALLEDVVSHFAPFVLSEIESGHRSEIREASSWTSLYYTAASRGFWVGVISPMTVPLRSYIKSHFDCPQTSCRNGFRFSQNYDITFQFTSRTDFTQSGLNKTEND